MSETQSQSRTEERLTDIEPDLAREIVTGSQETHLVFVFADERPEDETTVEYRAVGQAAAVHFDSPRTEHAYEGHKLDLWSEFRRDVQATVDRRTAAGDEVTVEYYRGESPDGVPDFDFGEDVRLEVRSRASFGVSDQ